MFKKMKVLPTDQLQRKASKSVMAGPYGEAYWQLSRATIKPRVDRFFAFVELLHRCLAS